MKPTLLLLLFLAVAPLHAQDSLVNGAVEVPRGFVRQADQKIKAIDHRLTRQSGKYLRSLRRQEEKIYRKLSKTDSSGAAGFFGDINNTYASLSRKINNATGKVDRLSSGEYIAGLDSLQGTLAFLKEAVKPGPKQKISGKR